VVVPFDKINEITSEKQEAEKSDKAPKKERKSLMAKKTPAAEKKAPKEEVPAPEPKPPQEPKEAPRKSEQEQIVFINLSELHAFKNHPFGVRDDEEMRAMVESVKDKGVTQPAIVRPREDGGYEIVSGHRRQKASELAGYFEMPCIVRNLSDEEAITQMVEDNTNQRETILPSERAKALKCSWRPSNGREAGRPVHFGQDGRSPKTDSVPTRLWPNAIK
jgi:hypothetical protein